MPSYDEAEIKAYDSAWKPGEVSLSKGVGNTATVVDFTPYQAMQVIAALSTWLSDKAGQKLTEEASS